MVSCLFIVRNQIWHKGKRKWKSREPWLEKLKLMLISNKKKTHSGALAFLCLSWKPSSSSSCGFLLEIKSIIRQMLSVLRDILASRMLMLWCLSVLGFSWHSSGVMPGAQLPIHSSLMPLSLKHILSCMDSGPKFSKMTGYIMI